ncbi:SIMPL domain-containing protein [Fulvivirga sp. 29W222]|uniref:SIMPL domain-containing protein n=1 Tax=Fulvivirga marina TaxID=2494733 RepID=A0A937G6C7_9BACT|nr:SIMPL domain-containing protein [Fulvivirga marina]MBL6449246.1 SIMPL domain-containing protein [Fulvivirga marina]
MKKLALIAAILVSGMTYAQQQNQQPFIKKIEVMGTAEMEVVPDEIYLRIALKEYKENAKIVNMDKLEAQLVKAVDQLGLPKENLMVDNIYGYNWDWRKKKSDDFLATKSFKLKVSNVKMVNNLIEKLDPEGINSMGVAEITHSKIKEYQNNLKLQALKTAKEKASHLLKGIGEELGGALEIHEEDYGTPQPLYERSRAYSKAAQNDSYQSDLEFKTIKIKSNIRAIFEIE